MCSVHNIIEHDHDMIEGYFIVFNYIKKKLSLSLYGHLSG